VRSVKKVLVNITRNRFKNQWGNALAGGYTLSDFGGTDSHGRHVQHSQAGDFGTQGIKLTPPLNLREQLHKL
jgi:hypothetical protein